MDITFKWRYKDSKAAISSSSVHTVGNRSWLTIVPQTEEDYGRIICWGKNSIGLQREPCVFNLIHAGPPEPVHNCTLVNQTEESLTVACQEGYDGGMEQTFHMELHDAEQRTVQGNFSFTRTVGTSVYYDESSDSIINLKTTEKTENRVVISAFGLTSATTYIMAIWASNSRGQSLPTMLVGHTIPAPISLTRRGRNTLS